MSTHALVSERKAPLSGGVPGGSYPMHGGTVAPAVLLPAAGQGVKPLLGKRRQQYVHVCMEMYMHGHTHAVLYIYVSAHHLHPRVSWHSMDYLLQTTQ